MEGNFCWTELATGNVAAAKEFYGKLFGWTFIEHSMGEMTYTMIQKGDKPFAGIWAIPKQEEGKIPPHWMSYVSVDKLESSLEKVVKLGGQIIVPPTQVADMGRFSVIIDPTGASIALWQTLK